MGCGASKTPDPSSDLKPVSTPTPEEPAKAASPVKAAAQAEPPKAAAAPSGKAAPATPASGGATTAVFIFGHDVSNKASICAQLKDSLGCVHVVHLRVWLT